MYVFASSVCFTRNLARFWKKKFARLRQRLLSLSLKKVIHPFNWLLRLVSWAQCLVFVDWLSDAPEAKDSNFPDPVGHRPTFPLFLVVNLLTFDLSCLWSSFTRHLSIPHRPPSRATIQTETKTETKIWDKNLRAVNWLAKTNKRILTRPAVSSGEERGLLSRTAAGNRA